ncbi:exonuclease SbcD [Chryseobacterium bernardetii]|uniref:Nuclease SbcCD subunit D n=2 Tax=Chryseobacterium TaxID=59732 RepID=A0A543E926_9FLAO|nr:MULTISPECIES: exonuclease SbcCD subunit D [Chryseobacterium]MDR6371668.1 exonuclease SbcD [Chryseobacterium vietnamense]MDR6443156.1 exonuclease SbcD [Chryseobacterium bernardetii]TQM18087.1 exodeoxyribonuclease I subunit D [Chryseobacterium aquifrigidense]
MKILHTADWHLGKRLDRFSRLEEQVLVMNEIVQIADEQNVDLVLIAGDLFDNFNPGVEAAELFYKTLKRLSLNGKRPVIAISGNHDSPSLINAPDPLARECGIILIGHPKAEIVPFGTGYFNITNSKEGFIELKIDGINFPVRILHTPFANEIRLKEYFGENKEEEINKVLAQEWKNLADQFCDDTGVNLLTAHLYMNKRGAEILEEPEGEKPIKIGNADLIFSDSIPEQIQYTALGHLHGFQNIGTKEKPVVYSSSPLCYSFSEAGQKKYVSIIDVEPGKAVSYEKKILENGRTLVRKTFNSIEDAVQWLSDHPNTFIELTLESETFLTADERRLIYQSHNGIVHLIPKVRNLELSEDQNHVINLSQDIDILFKDYFKSKNGGQEANEELMNLFNEILNA